MEKVLEQALPKVTETIEEVPVPVLNELVEPEPQGIGVGGCIGLGVGVVVTAAILAKLYKCTAKK